MDVSDLDFKKLSEVKEIKVKEIVKQITSRGNFSETAEQEKELINLLKLAPHICPCNTCKMAKDRSKIESYSLSQVLVFKAADFNKDNLKFIIAPFRHMNNEDFIISPLFGLIGRLFAIMKKILEFELNIKIKKFVMNMDNTYGTDFEEMGEHGHVTVTFFKE